MALETWANLLIAIPLAAFEEMSSPLDASRCITTGAGAANLCAIIEHDRGVADEE